MVKTFLNFIEKDPKNLLGKKIKLKKYSKNFTIFSHYKSLKKKYYLFKLPKIDDNFNYLIYTTQ